MRDVTTEIELEYMNELGQLITIGRLSLRDKFELACFHDSRLVLMMPRDVPVIPARLVDSVTEVLRMLDEYPEQLVPVNRKSALIRELRSAVIEATGIKWEVK